MSHEQDIAAWVERQYTKPKTDYSPYVFGIVAVVVVLWLISRPHKATTPAPSPVEYHTLAERIAFADRGTYDATTVAPLLKRLAAKFSTSEDEIANATFRAQELLQSKYTVSMGMVEIMSMADDAGVTGPTYREVLGVYVGLREKRNHDQAVSTMQAMWEDLGL